MKRYIDAGKLIAEIERRIQNLRGIAVDNPMLAQTMRLSFEGLLSFIASLQQDEKAVEFEMCSQAYWEEQGWIMIPPDVTIEGIDSLLKQVRKKLLQKQPEQIEEYGPYARQYPKSKVSQEQPEVDLEKAVRNVYESWMGGTMDDVRRDMVELGKVLNARKEGK